MEWDGLIGEEPVLWDEPNEHTSHSGELTGKEQPPCSNATSTVVSGPNLRDYYIRHHHHHHYHDNNTTPMLAMLDITMVAQDDTANSIPDDNAYHNINHSSHAISCNTTNGSTIDQWTANAESTVEPANQTACTLSHQIDSSTSNKAPLLVDSTLSQSSIQDDSASPANNDARHSPVQYNRFRFLNNRFTVSVSNPSTNRSKEDTSTTSQRSSCEVSTPNTITITATIGFDEQSSHFETNPVGKIRIRGQHASKYHSRSTWQDNEDYHYNSNVAIRSRYNPSDLYYESSSHELYVIFCGTRLTLIRHEQYWRMRRGLTYDRDSKEEIKEMKEPALNRNSYSKECSYIMTNRHYSNETSHPEAIVSHDASLQPTFIVKGLDNARMNKQQRHYSLIDESSSNESLESTYKSNEYLHDSDNNSNVARASLSPSTLRKEYLWPDQKPEHEQSSTSHTDAWQTQEASNTNDNITTTTDNNNNNDKSVWLTEVVVRPFSAVVTLRSPSPSPSFSTTSRYRNSYYDYEHVDQYYHHHHHHHHRKMDNQHGSHSSHTDSTRANPDGSVTIQVNEHTMEREDFDFLFY
ncbi:hypothetical protein BDF22DRAFT_741174 [Syncephalis plumigaleata]|nr:hypothetical protein BDF22DRAFT_741174 [Syncephalis plumigaleata]